MSVEPLMVVTALTALAALLIAGLGVSYYRKDRGEVKQMAYDVRQMAADIKKALASPEYGGAVLRHAFTGGVTCEDGSPANVPDIVDGLLSKHGPALYARLEAQLPTLIPIVMQSLPGGPNNPSPNAGRDLANQRWGGVRAAKAAAGVAKSIPGGKAAALGEYVQVAAQALPLLDEVKKYFEGKGNDNGSQDYSRPHGRQQQPEWRPPV